MILTKKHLSRRSVLRGNCRAGSERDDARDDETYEPIAGALLGSPPWGIERLCSSRVSASSCWFRSGNYSRIIDGRGWSGIRPAGDSQFVGIRNDKPASEVDREPSA